jgi:succinyl-CoA synthetase beta subunit
MKIHEYQAKEILRKYNVPVPGGEMATTLEEADTAAKALFAARATRRGGEGADPRGRPRQGRRREAGQDAREADAAAKAILGMQLVTHQTGPAGQKVQRLLIEEGSAIERELYLGLVLDRASGEDRVYGVAVGRHGD